MPRCRKRVILSSMRTRLKHESSDTCEDGARETDLHDGCGTGGYMKSQNMVHTFICALNCVCLPAGADGAGALE